MDWLFGSQTPADAAQSEEQRRAAIPRERHPDEVAVERYRYLLRTAPPETIEQAHADAFAQLTPEQRALVFQELSAGASPAEQPRADDPRSLAQAATRRELQAPGTLERSFSPQRGAGGMGFGGMLGSSMLGSIAGVVIGSAIAQSFIPSGVGEAAGAEGTDAGADAGADGGVEAGGGGFFDGGDSFGGDSFGDFGF
ncbi:hypothetical protein [Microterricola pindariensis]|nr:hypothetical protein [Microterricola pindariensis]